MKTKYYLGQKVKLDMFSFFNRWTIVNCYASGDIIYYSIQNMTPMSFFMPFKGYYHHIPERFLKPRS